MAYIVRSSEKTAASASEMETKALLHLLCEDVDKGAIDSFAIDFFNDVTGMDSYAFHLYDIQSKGEDSGAGELGDELVTLFKNYVSDFKDRFDVQILFVRKVTKPVLGGKDLSQFRYSDMTARSQVELRKRLVSICKKKSYIDDAAISDENIDAFLNQVLFVVAKKDKEDYIRPLIKAINTLGTTDRELRGIFNEIRRRQIGIKTSSKVEGLEVADPSDVYMTSRILSRKSIDLLVISRVLNRNPLEAGVPGPFRSIYDSLDEDEADDRIEVCQNQLALQLCSVNEFAAFWALLGEIVTLIHTMPDADIRDIYRGIAKETLIACHQLNPMSCQYLIAIVKEGLK